MKTRFEVWNNECMGNLRIAYVKTPKSAINQTARMLKEGYDIITITRIKEE